MSAANEGSSNLVIRGGNPDQTLILMDGVPIYNRTHLYGLFSVFNPDAVNNVELTKGGFPARYGGRTSGVTDITLREGNIRRVSGQFSAGIMASRLLLEGPIGDKTSFLVTGRINYMALVDNEIRRRVGQGLLDNYRFYDLNVKLNHQFNARNRVYFGIYNGRDNTVGNSEYTQYDTTSIGRKKNY